MAKINFKKGLTDIVLYIIIFIVVQIFLTYAGAGIWAAVKGEGYQATLLAMDTGNNAILKALTTVFSNVITLIIFLKAKALDQSVVGSFVYSGRYHSIGVCL